nr:type I-C CRISPR-associated protein Cas5c [Dehalococcoides mccartyi]
MNEAMTKSPTIRLQVWGRNACFTRPEMKVERVSYDVITPSAARGILEAIHWKPAIRWIVEQIDVINPIRWESVRRNEVGCVISPRTECIFIEDKRQQRAGRLLRDVCYIIHAHFEMTGKAGDSDNIAKHLDIFARRAEKGKCFQRPYFGCREFTADFVLLHQNDKTPEPKEKLPELGFESPRDIGYILLDILHDNSLDEENKGHFCTEKCQAYFFRAKIHHGQIKDIPRLEDVR